MERKFGFKESRKEREEREKNEKTAKWREQVEKQDPDKLAKELDMLTRATFLTPHQRARKRTVTQLLDALSKTKQSASSDGPNKELSLAQLPTTAPVSSGAEANDDDDDGAIIFGKKVVKKEDTSFFVPRSVKREQHIVVSESEKAQKEAEKKILTTTAPTDDELDEFLADL